MTLTACDAIDGLAGGTEEKKDAASATADASGAPAAPALEANLTNPQAGDIWAANLDFFSAADFNIPGDGDAYGLVRIVDVNAEQVTIITENGAAPTPESAASRLDDYLGGVSWDEQEQIRVNRADFAEPVSNRRILGTTRPSGAGAAASASSADSNAGDYSAGPAGNAASEATAAAADAAANAAAPPAGGGK